MRLTLIGHATWLVESRGVSVLMDPVFGETFRNGKFAICPSRTVDSSELPGLDAVIISHKHRDHFDLESLAQLDRKTPVLCPCDPSIVAALERLGFPQVVQVNDWQSVRLRHLHLAFTPSMVRVPEHGVLVTDGEATFWNQVDTQIDGETISRVRKELGHVDFVAHGYQPSLEIEALEGRATNLDAEAYRRILHRVRCLAPRALAPAANGYRTAGSAEWFNAFMFPISRERFVRDVQKMAPDIQCVISNPGDVIELRKDELEVMRQAATRGFVRMVAQDSAHMSFNPAASRPPLTDENPGQVPLQQLRGATERFFRERVQSVASNLLPAHPARVVQPKLEYQVVFPDSHVAYWRVQFNDEGAAVTPAVSAWDDADFVMKLAASTLHDLVTGRTRIDVVMLAGEYRSFQRGYVVGQHGLVTIEELAPAELHGGRTCTAESLLHEFVYFESDAEVRLIHVELDRLLDGYETDEPFWQRVSTSAAAE